MIPVKETKIGSGGIFKRLKIGTKSINQHVVSSSIRGLLMALKITITLFAA